MPNSIEIYFYLIINQYSEILFVFMKSKNEDAAITTTITSL